MPRFNFTEITLQSRADITDVMDNFDKIENLAATSDELTSAVNTLNNTINTKETALKAVATTNANGMMSKTDKAKLDGIESNANNYNLPTAGKNALGGVKTSSNVTDATGYTPVPIIGGIPYYKDTNTTYSNATSSADGLMSSTDKSKLDGIEVNANNYTLPTASSTLGGVKTTSQVTSNSGYTACPIIGGVPYYKDTNTTYSNATTSSNGLMSSTDKSKLDGIASGATKTSIIDNLTSTSTTAALSANQGRVLNSNLSGKAPTNHASTATTYGVGTTEKYGHVKVINNLTSESFANGEALAAYQGKLLRDALLNKQKIIYVGRLDPTGGNDGDIYLQYFT